MSPPTGRRAARIVAVALLWAIAACGGASGDGSAPAPAWVGDVRRAATAVEAALGGPQEFFEITATPQLTNVFVAVDGATAAIPYVFVDGQLRDPAPRLDATGQTFTAAALGFDEERVLGGVERELPQATVDALSVEGGPGGAVRYVVTVRSEQGGVLDVEVGPDGAVLAVDPL